MALKPQAIPPVPEETARIAHLIWPKGNRYLQLRDELGTLYTDDLFVKLYPHLGSYAEAPWRLALICVMQYMENYTDREAAEAVRSRIDWKYVLSLELSDPGIDFSVLSEFRMRLLEGKQEELLLNVLLEHCRQRGWLKERGKQRTDSTHVLAAIRVMNRLMCVAETLRAALNALAVVAPQWLRAQVSPDWYERYGCRIEDFRWPQQESQREAIAVQIGADGHALLQAIFSQQAPTWLRELPAVEVLRRVWVQQYSQVEGQVYWRANDNLPPASVLISSPYDPEAHFSVKRSTSWTGFKVHVTETCEEDRPHLITHVETTSATTQDKECTADIHQALADKQVLPSEHFMDTGYVDGEHLVRSRAQGIDLVGPVTVDPSWQAKAGQGFDATKFTINWEAKQVTCPQGQSSRKWKLTHERNDTEIIRVEFGKADCLACPVRALCTTALSNPRQLTLRPQAQYEAIQAARKLQSTPAFKERYALRAGIEGTLSQGVRAFGLRQARYLGQAKTHLQHVFTAAAMNVTRLLAWLDEVPFSTTRTSRFAALAP